MQVIVEGVGPIEFEDGTDPKVISSVIRRDFGDKRPESSGSFMDTYLPSIKRTGEIYNQEVQSGMDAMQKAGEEPTGRNLVQGVLGAGRMAFSPLTAFAKGIVREPIQGTLEAVGVPKETTIGGTTIPVADFIGQTVEDAVGFVPYGGLVKRAMGAAETTTGMVKGAKGVAEKGVPKDPLKFPTDMNPDIVTNVQKPISATGKEVLQEGVVKDVIDAVKAPVTSSWNPTGSTRITQEVVDYLMQNKDQIPKTLERYGLTPEEFAAQMKETMSTSGRQLGQMGKWAQQIRKEFESPEMRKLANYMEKDLPDPTTLDSVMDVWKKAENVRRVMMVTQTATAMRNTISQGARLTIGSIDDAFQGATKGVLSGKVAKDTTMSTLRGLGEGLDAWTALWHRMTPNGRRVLGNVLDADQAIKAKSMLYGAPIQDVALTNKVTKALNYLNTTQEYFFRNIATEAKLNQMLKESGVAGGIKGIDPKNIPPKMLEQAADYGLEMTFSAMPKSNFGKDMVKSMSNPIFTSLLNPFPRFMWGNALPFLKNFSPIGFLEAANPKVVAKLANGNPAEFAKYASQATIGTMMLNTASYIRNNPEIGGEKWYEIKAGGKTWDTRAFAPFSTYLFIAEAMSNPEKVKPSDVASALFSMNRVAGTGLVATDIIRGKGADTTKDILTRLGGEYLGSFSTPARTIKDIYSAVDPKEAIVRDVREKEFVGPTMRNIPVVSQKLPESVTPLDTKPITTETPVLRQTTGLTYKIKKPIQAEMDRLDIGSEKFMPRTGIPEADRAMSKIMAPMVENVANQVLTNENYQKATDNEKKLLWRELFKGIKKDARTQLLIRNPKLYSVIKFEGIPQEETAILKDRGVILPNKRTYQKGAE